MPRIDPALLLNTLSVLLSPSGGIKECEDVQRVVNLMTKFSKKLISKCVYIRILLATDRTLLDSFYGAGGWQLVFTWLSDAIAKQNWPLVEALLELLHASPVTSPRLASNQCPQHVRDLPKQLLSPASQLLVDEITASWSSITDDGDLAIIEVDAAESKATREQPQPQPVPPATAPQATAAANTVQTDNKWKMEVRDRVVVFKKIDSAATKPAVSVSEEVKSPAAQSNESSDKVDGDDKQVKPDSDTDVNKENNREKRSEKVERDQKASQVKDGNKKQQSKQTTKPDISADGVKPSAKSRELSSSRDGKTRKRDRSESQSDSSRKRKDRDHRSGDRSASKSSRHHSRSSSSSRKDSHSKSHDSKSKERDSRKIRELAEKEKQREKQTMKDRETLAKVCSAGKLNSMTAIPKKSSESSGGSSGKSESSDKSESTTKRSELRRATVKTYRSKFRSTGLESDINTAAKSRPEKPATQPRPRPHLPSTASSVPASSVPASSTSSSSSEAQKRVLPEGVSPTDKRSRVIEQRSPVQSRPGGTNSNSTKPIQEATGFMDALNASSDVKKKTVKKPRRLSSREDKKDEKESTSGAKAGEQKTQEKEEESVQTPDAKPTLKFYQDTLDESKADDSSANKSKASETNSDETTAEEQKEDEEEPPAPATIPLERLPSVDGDSSTPTTATSGPTSGGPRGVLVLHRSPGKKRRSVTWRPDSQLVDVSYFELNENERVNVNRAKFEEMQAMEKLRERDVMRLARATLNDGMREQMAWRLPLLLIDSAEPLVQPGINSSQCHVQQSRERAVFPFPYGAAKMPDTPAEPDPEYVDPRSDESCRPIPLHGDQQYGAVVSDFRDQGWPAPRIAPAPGDGLMPDVGPMYPGHEAMFPPNGAPLGVMAGHPAQLMQLSQQHPRLVPWGGNGVGPEMAGVFPGAGMARPPVDPLMGAPGVWHGARGPVRSLGAMARGAPPPGFAGAPGLMAMPPRPMRGGVGLQGAMPGPVAPRGAPGRGSRGNGGWRRETVCKHFMSGYCRNGRMCSFLHPGLAKRPGENAGVESTPPLVNDQKEDNFV